MKRIICLITALCLVFSSFSFCFAATQDVSDAQTHTILGNLYNLLNGSDFKGRLNNIFNKLVDINDNLVTLMGWLDPSTGGSTTALLNQILNALVYTDAGGALTSWLVDIQGYNYQTAERILDLKTLDNVNGFEGFNGGRSVTIKTINGNGQEVTNTVNMSNQNWRSNFGAHLNYIEQYVVRGSAFATANFNTSQTPINWETLQSGTSFTPTSATNGIYTWLKNIQAPVARLSYVLASDERIEAQEAAAANEEAVVDNFIDSSGSGAASTTDIGSISDLSSGYKSNFGSDASVTGIFNIFNSNNMGWFSSETYNQLDTTNNNRRSINVPDTPLLNQKIEDIYEAIGLDNDR